MSKSIITIPIDASFSFSECLWYLNRNFDDCLHQIGKDYIIKSLKIDKNQVLFKISAEENALKIAIQQGSEDTATQDTIKDYVIEWLDLEKDLDPFYKLLKRNNALAYMIKDFQGLRLVGIPDLFEAVCWCIIGQQINLTFAYKIKRRLVEKYGDNMIHNGTVHYTFPTAQILADADEKDLRAMQLSAKKVEYLVTTAKAFAEGLISKDLLIAMPDFVSRQNALTSLKGIGVWTANYSLMKSLKEPSCIPFGDAGLLNALVAHHLIKDKKDVQGIVHFFQQVPGWESYMAFYFWRSLSIQ
ncbi:DNA repair protein [Mucilaginibacter sp. cycad4]|uniref:DNA-3-methyladenine glycosylase family protein n=1 Tax=Mucilaginibacter sp. cycad4 TaxID=3342096 RepID=UPI002AAB41FC|nr:DNA glycosylase [Mucilaginibacter gossypii]WPV02114.1 DNA repair protein [Mucilaginibacter gossypii]